ncbi:hypothetical protein [Polyangium jinanense]|uniref:Uncharacterized protein n=1 Tax=Polyangium jinanense TaxID=2829994 RepID=A0A9X3WW41_9BACT|nr:hypothetical protein [Polyangium jinanense]MDC3953605.1 hypothetical protein [Polyangium jinanense]MDC3979274.1 hypothetical protein [Polyangium jinanense]
MRQPVILLGKGEVSLAAADGDVLVEPEGSGLEAIEALLARSPRAAVVTSGGDEGFFRASLCLERGVKAVVLRRGAFVEAYEKELAARARSFGRELFVHDDTRGYERVRAASERVQVGAPEVTAWEAAVRATTGKSRQAATIGLDVDAAWEEAAEAAEPLPMDAPVPGLSENLEEVAFTNGDKPVLYLVVPARSLDAVRARHPGAAMALARAEALPLAVEGATGRRIEGASGEATVHVFFSTDPDLAARAASLWEQGSSRNAAAIGELLGYPPCCTAAFVALADRRNNAALVYVTAARTRALGASFHPLLDVAVRRVVPFTPCSFGCERAASVAARVVASLPRDQSEPLTRALARPVLYLDEARAVALEGAQIDGAAITFESARFLPAPASLDPEGELFARKLFGALFEGGGALVCTDDAFEVRGASFNRRLGRTTPRLGVLLPFGGSSG